MITLFGTMASGHLSLRLLARPIQNALIRMVRGVRGMQNCPVCGQPVQALGACGAAGEEGSGGIVVNLTGQTYTVHVACLESFERMMSTGQLAPA